MTGFTHRDFIMIPATDPISMKFIIILLLLLRRLSSCSGSSSDVQCLKDLKESLGDPNGSLSTWNFSDSDTSICGFAGVECWRPGENRVLSLHLNSMGLQGSFPRGLQFCSDMVVLTLSGNSLSGPLPADINRQLMYITTLDLSNNRFSGEIPSGIMNMTFLSALKLQQNRFTGRIPEMKTDDLPRLTEFSVADNSLSGPISASLRRFPAEDFAGNGGLCGPPLDRDCKKRFHIHLHRVNDASSIGTAAGFVAGFVVAFYFPHWFVFCGGLRPYIVRVCT